MFAPNPAFAQEPVVLDPHNRRALVLHFKSWKRPEEHIDDKTLHVDTIGARAVRWRTVDGPVMVSHNQDYHAGPPTKHFLAESGEFVVAAGVHDVCFFHPTKSRVPVTIYMEIGS